MKVLLLFIFTTVFIGGAGVRPARWIRERHLVLMAFAFAIAASYWSLGVVLG